MTYLAECTVRNIIRSRNHTGVPVSNDLLGHNVQRWTAVEMLDGLIVDQIGADGVRFILRFAGRNASYWMVDSGGWLVGRGVQVGYATSTGRDGRVLVRLGGSDSLCLEIGLDGALSLHAHSWLAIERGRGRC